MCTFGLSGCRVNLRRPHETGPPGFAHTIRELQTCTFHGPGASHHQNSTKGQQERERRKKIVAGRGKKKAKFWVFHFRPPPSGAPPFGASIHLSGLPPFGASTFLVHKFNKSNLAEVEVGRTRKEKLAEVEIGRSRSRSKYNTS